MCHNAEKKNAASGAGTPSAANNIIHHYNTRKEAGSQ